MPSPPLQLAFILVNDGAPASVLKDALEKFAEIPAKPRLYAANGSASLFGWLPVAAASGSGSHPAPTALARAAMQKLPLVDAFFLVCLDGREIADLSAPVGRGGASLWRQMANEYAQARLKLGRIVVPTRGPTRLWPWLIDIGFRQPFVELGDGAAFESVLEANRSEVSTVAL